MKDTKYKPSGHAGTPAQKLPAPAETSVLTETPAPAQAPSPAAASKLMPQGSTVFALDIGTRTVVGILGEYIDENFKLSEYVSIPHTKRAMVDGQVQDIRQTAKIVAQVKDELEKRSGLKLERVAIAAAGRALKTCRLSVDFDVSAKESITEDDVKSMEIEAVQKAQAQLDEETGRGATMYYCVGYSIVNYRLDDYKMISLEGHKGVTAQVELIAAFLPGIVVESLYTVMDLNHLEVTSLTLEPIAAMNVIVPQEIRLINIALVDIGAGTSDIAIAKDGTVYAYAMATTAGDEITEELIRTYLVDFNTAERLKQSCSTGDEELEFRDILGVSHKIKASEIYEKLTPALDSLAETICSAIIEVNGGSPAAVFLIGGGSLIEGLPALVAKKLKLEESRVAIGGGDFLKNVDEQGAQLNAEYVTPLGIAVTSGLNQGYDFSVISVNGQKVRAFDTKQLSVFEALRLAGFKTADIMGRSGASLSFSLNGRRVTRKGGGFTSAEVYVNDVQSSVTAKVTQGDRIRFKPAVCGENASAKLSDEIDFSRAASGTVIFCGQRHRFGIRAYVNGTEQEPDYDIQPLDNIETDGIATLGDLLQVLEIEMDGIRYRINGELADEDTLLSDLDEITYADEDLTEESRFASAAAQTEIDEATAEADTSESAAETDASGSAAEKSTEEQQKDEKTANAPETASKSEEQADAPRSNAIPFDRTSSSKLHLTLNGEEVAVERTGSQNMLFDLLNLIEIDPTAPNSELILEINGVPANFSSPIHEGDNAVIRVQERLAK